METVMQSLHEQARELATGLMFVGVDVEWDHTTEPTYDGMAHTGEKRVRLDCGTVTFQLGVAESDYNDAVREVFSTLCSDGCVVKISHDCETQNATIRVFARGITATDESLGL